MVYKLNARCEQNKRARFVYIFEQSIYFFHLKTRGVHVKEKESTLDKWHLQYDLWHTFM